MADLTELLKSTNAQAGVPARHPPGYLFYVLTARLATTIVGDPNRGLVALSIVSGALTCPLGLIVGVSRSPRHPLRAQAR